MQGPRGVSRHLGSHAGANIDHLHQVFRLFSDLGITLKPRKSYLGYPNITLLGQHVDAFGLTTEKEKMKALTDLQFSSNLKELETYLGLTGWLRSYISYYVQITAPLQLQKTELLRQSPKAKSACKAYVRRTSMDPTPEEMTAFTTLQRLFEKPTFLAHFDPAKRLYIDIDVSKQYGFGGVVYHVDGDPIDMAEIQQQKICPILFLSKLLTPAERKYWPTELETAALVWVVRKMRHMIETSGQTKTTVIFTDHSATTTIAKQTHLTTTVNIDKLNLRLI